MLRKKYEKALGRSVSFWEAIRLTLEFLPAFGIGRYGLLLLFASMVFAQDCRIPVNFSISSGVITPGVGAPFNNKALACVNWQMNVFVSGISTLSIQLESATDLGGNTPGGFVAFGGTLLSGTNPITVVNQATSTFTGMFPWLRVNPTSATGTGNVVGIIYGFKATSSSINPAFGATGAGAYFGTFVPVNFSSFTFLNQVAGHIGAQYLNAVNISNPRGTAAATWDFLCVPVSNLDTTATTITAAMQIPLSSNAANNSQWGIGMANSGTSANRFFFADCGTGTDCKIDVAARCTNFTNASCAVTATPPWGNVSNVFSAPFVWLRWVADGAGNMTAFYGVDGFHWSQANQNTQVIVDTDAPNRACMVYLQGDNNFNANVNFVSWQITNP